MEQTRRHGTLLLFFEDTGLIHFIYFNHRPCSFGQAVLYAFFARANRYHRFLSAQKMTSVNSRCATFTNEADGYVHNEILYNGHDSQSCNSFLNSPIRYVPSEGAAGLILKTRSAAIRDGDNILAVVRSTAVKHNGRTEGLIAPKVKTQVAMQISLLENADLTPDEVEYVAFHSQYYRIVVYLHLVSSNLMEPVCS